MRVADESQPQGAPRLGRFPRPLGKRTVETKVHVQHHSAQIVVQQVLAIRLGAPQHPPVEQCGAVGEASLGATGPNGVAAEDLLVAAGQPVDRVAFRHSGGLGCAQVAAQLLRQGEGQSLLGVRDLFDVAVTALGEPAEDVAHQHLRYGRPR